MSSLVIVESASKCKTIKKYLGANYIVTFSAGHICDLPKDKLGIDTDSWTAQYIVTNKKLLDNIRNLVKKCDNIYIASDPDIEGEAIAHHIQNHIQDLLKNKNCFRIKFNEITKNVIIHALENPCYVDLNIVEAQETRRIVDRLIGYKLSPLLWSKFNNNYLSAGRVQFAALIMCINQRNKILKKELIPCWTILGDFNIASSSELQGTLYVNGSLWKVSDEKKVIDKLESLEISNQYNVSYTNSIKKTGPFPPFTTTSMQQEAYNKLRFSSKYTMKLAQTLYEHGFITYMRTDSMNISDTAKWKILEYIKKEYGEENAKYRTYKTKVANAQEAHEAIRITHPEILSDSLLFEGCTKDHKNLYNLIWKRTLASLMSDAEFMEFNIIITKDINEFKCTKSFLIKPGFYLVYVYDTDDKCESYADFQKLLDSSRFACCRTLKANGDVDNIPSMYNEVQLIKELEKEGIGRPSTYATTIDKLLNRNYVERGMNPQQQIELNQYEKNKKGMQCKNKIIHLGGKQKDLLIPTDLGISCIEYIYHCAEYLCDLKFTARLEEDMDNIIHKTICKNDVLNDLYKKICATLTINNNDKQKESIPRVSSIIHSKYGYCYYDSVNKKYTSVEGYMKWQKKTAKELNDTDINFIKSLPKKITLNGTEVYLHLGKYGLYAKNNKGENIKIEKQLWSQYI